MNPQSNRNGTDGSASAQRNGDNGQIRLKPGAKGESQPGEVSLAEAVAGIRMLWVILKSRWLVGFGGAAVVAVGMWFLLMRSEPEYVAVTSVLAQSELDDILQSPLPDNLSRKDREDVLSNHLDVMRSRRFSVLLAGRFTPEERSAIMAPYVALESERFKASFEQLLAFNIGAERERNRDMFKLSFRHLDPDVAVTVANRMASAYLELAQDEYKEANIEAAQFLRMQIDEIHSDIIKLENEQRDYRKKNSIVSLQENQGLMAERLRRIEVGRTQARLERIRLEMQLEGAEADLAAAETPFDNSMLANFGNTQHLRQELNRLSAEREEMALRYGPNHSKMRDSDAAMNAVKSNLANNFQLALSDLRSRHGAALIEEHELDKELKAAFDSSIEVGRLADKLMLFDSAIEAKRDTMNALLRRESNADLLSKLPTDVMRVIDPAYIVEPIVSKRHLYGSLIALCSGFTFIVFPLLAHFFDQRIKSPTDVERELGQDLLGGVPHLARVRSALRPHIVRDRLDMGSAAMLMAMVAQVELSSRQDGSKCFLVTSAVPGEGKSMITSNLAAGFTQLGRRTLLIDCDLRHPAQQRLQGVSPVGGLVPWSVAGCELEHPYSERSRLGIQRLSDGTYLLPCGGQDANPSRLLVSREMKLLLVRLKQDYDVLLIDTPPAGLFPEVLVLARNSSETLLVARESKAPVAQIKRLVTDLEKTASPVLGVILNDYSSRSRNPHLAYGYDRYGYRPPEETEKSSAEGKSLISAAMSDKGR